MATAQSGGSEAAGPDGRPRHGPLTGHGGRVSPAGHARPAQASRRGGGRAAPPPRGSGGGTEPCSSSAGCRRRGSSSPFASGGWCRAGRPQVARAEGRGTGSCVPFPEPGLRWMVLVTLEVHQQSLKKLLRGADREQIRRSLLAEGSFARSPHP